MAKKNQKAPLSNTAKDDRRDLTRLALLRLPAVIARTGLSRSSIYLRMSEDSFPKKISLGGDRAVGWIESEIAEWIAQRISQSRNTA